MAIFSLKSKEVLSNLTAPANIDLGAMIPIATQTVGAGGTSSITFSSIPQNYEHLELRVISQSSYTAYNSNVQYQFNSDTASNYAWHYIAGESGSGAFTGVSTSSTLIRPDGGATPGSYYAAFGYFIVSILDYANTNKYKTLRSLGGFENNTSGRVTLGSGLWMNANAITSITLTLLSGNFVQGCSAALYGIKRAGA